MFFLAKKFIFCNIKYFWMKNAFFTISESKIRKKKSNILLKGYSIA